MGCGTLLQIVAYGSQDIYLTGNPQFSFFKTVFKRHTNFTIESIRQNFTNIVKFDEGNIGTNQIYSNSGNLFESIIEHKGDLIKDMHLEIDLIYPTEINEDGEIIRGKLVKRPGHALIDWVEIQIGGITIDKQYGEWIDIWSQISNTRDQYKKLERMIDGSLVTYKSETQTSKIYIPLNFWFSKNTGMALPLLSLKYSEVKFRIRLKTDIAILSNNGANQIHSRPIISDFQLYCDYIFLDSEEKKQFGCQDMEFLMEQVQCQNYYISDSAQPSANIHLKLNHPCKELIWVCQDSSNIQAATSYNYPFSFNKGNDGGDLIKSAYLLFNNNKRFSTRDANYFKYVQPYQFHTSQDLHSTLNIDERGFYYIYSFAINPEEYNPSGSCNFSRIDIPQLILELDDSIGDTKHIRIYAINYNIFKVSGGAGSLVFSN